MSEVRKGYSKFLKNIVDDLSFNFYTYSSNETQARIDGDRDVSALVLDVSSNLETEVSRIDGEIGGINGTISILDTTLTNLDISFNNWVTNNTNEIEKEVDKAINDISATAQDIIATHVTSEAFNTAVSQLESDISNGDTQLAQEIANRVVDRINVDRTHDEKINKLYNFVDLFLETYHLEDANGNVITTARVMESSYNLYDVDNNFNTFDMENGEPVYNNGPTANPIIQ